jgi:hypothetical protein
VIGGIALEGPEIFKDTREAFFGWKISSTAGKIIAGLSVVGWLLVVGGIVGEIKLEAFVSDVDARLETFDSTLIAQTQSETARANERAGNALDSAAATARDNTKLKGALDKETETARAEANSLGLKLAAQVSANLELQKSLMPRSFKQGDVSTTLEAFKGTPVYIETIGEFESRKTAELIRAALLGAHWDARPVVTRLDAGSLADFFFSGVSIGESCGSRFGDISQAANTARSLCDKATVGLVKALLDGGLPDVRAAAMSIQGKPLFDILPINSVMVRVGLRSVSGEKRENLFVSPTGLIEVPPGSRIGSDGKITPIPPSPK